MTHTEWLILYNSYYMNQNNHWKEEFPSTGELTGSKTEMSCIATTPILFLLVVQCTIFVIITSLYRYWVKGKRFLLEDILLINMIKIYDILYMIYITDNTERGFTMKDPKKYVTENLFAWWHFDFPLKCPKIGRISVIFWFLKGSLAFFRNVSSYAFEGISSYFPYITDSQALRLPLIPYFGLFFTRILILKGLFSLKLKFLVKRPL